MYPYILFQAISDESFHLCFMLLDAEEQVQLIVGAYKVVLVILALPVLVATEVIPQEAYTLHVGE
jgi:hypothetical protein